MTSRNVAITFPGFDLSNPAIGEFRSRNWNVVSSQQQQQQRSLTEDEVLDFLRESESVGVVAGIEPLTERVFEANPQLKAISRCGTGYESIDLAAAHRRDIRLRCTPDAPASAVAEYTIGLLLAALRSIPLADRTLRAADWEPQMGSLLARRRVGIVGLGRIGSRVADLCAAFGAKVSYSDPLVATARYPRHESLVELAAESDILSIHVPLNRGNRMLIDAEVISALPGGAVLVNTSMGGVVDEEAVTDALGRGQLSAAAFDVFQEEPYSGPLLGQPNAVVTPHMGAHAREARTLIEAESIHNLLDALARLGL